MKRIDWTPVLGWAVAIALSAACWAVALLWMTR